MKGFSNPARFCQSLAIHDDFMRSPQTIDSRHIRRLLSTGLFKRLQEIVLLSIHDASTALSALSKQSTPSLNRLDIQKCQIHAEPWHQCIARIGSNLRRVSISTCPGFHKTELHLVCTSCPALESLEIRNPFCSTKDMWIAITNLAKKCSALQSLILSRDGITRSNGTRGDYRAVDDFLKHVNPRLRSLQLVFVSPLHPLVMSSTATYTRHLERLSLFSDAWVDSWTPWQLGYMLSHCKALREVGLTSNSYFNFAQRRWHSRRQLLDMIEHFEYNNASNNVQ